jgi:hypothetical protein
MNSINHFRKLQAQYMPRRVFGSHINNLRLIKKLMRRQNEEPRTDKKSVFKNQIPSHLKQYPHLYFKPTDIINVEMRVKGDLKIDDLTKKIKVKKALYRIPTDIKDVKTPIHDAVDFKQMTGNEILLNLSNSEFLRTSELINGLYELSLRMNLKVNNDVKDYDILNHPYISKALNATYKYMFQYQLRHLIVLSLAFHKFGLKSSDMWNKLEVAFDKLLHKLKAKQIVFLLDLFNKDSVRGSKEFYSKLFTILPIHVEVLSIVEICQVIQVYRDQNLKNDRLLKYFIYPRIEKKMPLISLKNYVLTLNMLAELGYEEDKVFWHDHILPTMLNFSFTYEEVNKLWEVLLKVKVNCPSIDLAKYVLIIENLIKQFNVLKEKGQDISGISLVVDEQYRMGMPQPEGMTGAKIREAEKRLKHQPSLKGLLDVTKEEKGDLETSFTNILNIKDWGRVRYEMDLAEAKKARETRQEDAEAKKKILAEKKEIRKKEEEEKKAKEESLAIKKSDKKSASPVVVETETAEGAKETEDKKEEVKEVKKDEGKKDRSKSTEKSGKQPQRGKK